MNKYAIIDGEDLVVVGYTFNQEKYDDLCRDKTVYREEEGVCFNTFDPNKVIDYLVNQCNVTSVDNLKLRGNRGYVGIYDLKYRQLPKAFYTIKEIMENPFSLVSLEKILKVLEGTFKLDKEEVYDEYITIFNKFFECFEKKEISRKKVEEFRQSFNDYTYVYDLSISEDSSKEINDKIQKYIEEATKRTEYMNIFNHYFPDIIHIGWLVKERKLGN